jgi:hypothetical protein
MLKRIARIIGATADVARAEAEFARRRALCLGLACAGLVGLGVLGGIAGAGIGAAIVLWLSPLIGVAGALALVGAGMMLLASLGALAICASLGLGSGETVEDAREEADRARARLKSAATPLSSKPHSAKSIDASATAQELLKQIKLPDTSVLLGAAFAAVSVFGVRRTLRIARMVAAGASTGALLLKSVMEEHDASSNGHARGAGGIPAPGHPGFGRASTKRP